MMTGRIFLSLIFFASALLLSSVTAAQPTASDLLLYDDTEREPPGITAYNPATGEKLELPVNVSVETIRTSGDGLIAYIQDNDIWVLDVLNAPSIPINITQTPDEQESLWDWTPAGDGRIAYIQDNDIWVLDVMNAPNSPKNITQTPDEPESLLDWTPDGKLLQFRVGSDPGPYILYIYDGNEISAVDYGDNVERHWNEQGWYVARRNGTTDAVSWYVWNGEERVDLTLPLSSDESAWQAVRWTPNNNLFMIVGYNEQEDGQPFGPTDVFYWNGDTVAEVERPSQDETFLLGNWSKDGRLALYTSQNYLERYYVWDGVSFTSDGVPATSTLTPIAAQTENSRGLEQILWMPDGRLLIVARGDPALDASLSYVFSCADFCPPQVYVWESQELLQITSNKSSNLLIDVHPSGSIAVSAFDGLRIWGVTVFDNNLQAVFQAGGPHSSSRWSADGNVASCSGDGLLVWNGQDTIQLKRRSYSTFSKWLIAPSQSMLCSTG